MDAIAAFGCSWVRDTSCYGNLTDMSSFAGLRGSSLRFPPIRCCFNNKAWGPLARVHIPSDFIIQPHYTACNNLQNVIEIIAVNEFQRTEDSKRVPTLFREFHYCFAGLRGSSLPFNNKAWGPQAIIVKSYLCSTLGIE